MTPPRTIALVGLRASGKSSVGEALARLLDMPFVDLDDEVALLADEDAIDEEHKLSSVGSVWMVLGEPAFRDLESEALERVLRRPGACVLATGGGTIERERNREWLASRALVVWLDVPVPELQRRLRADDAARPPLMGKDAIDEVPEVARQRIPLYAEVAQVRVEAGAGTASEIAGRIAIRLNRPGLALGDPPDRLPG